MIPGESPIEPILPMLPGGTAGPRWQRRPEERRREILDAAFLVFGEMGFTRATLAHVAKHAGVSAGTISFHFKSKADLFEAVLRDKFVAFVENEEAFLIGHRGSYLELLHLLMRRQWARLSEPGMMEMVVVTFQEAAEFPASSQQLFQQIGERFHRTISATLEAGTRAGEFRALVAEGTARVISSLIIGTALTLHKAAKFDKVPLSCEQCFAGIVDFVNHAVGARPATGQA